MLPDGKPLVPKLTKEHLETIQPEEKEKIHWDSDYKGFGC
jgi:hypothetical protein